MAADEADPQVGVCATGAAAAGAGVAAEHAVAAHGAGCVAPVLDALAMKPVVAHLQGRGRVSRASSEAGDQAALVSKHTAAGASVQMPTGQLITGQNAVNIPSRSSLPQYEDPQSTPCRLNNMVQVA